MSAVFRITLITLVLFFLFIQPSKASHVPGANITYECVGPNQYVLTLTLFEDCGTAFQSTAALTVNATNNCGFANQFFSLPNILFQQEVSQLCPTQIGQSECNGGTLPGVYMHQWQGTVTLPGPCDSWVFSYTLCCRNTSTNITGASSYDIYVETIMNSVTDPCNTSAVINSQPIPYVCVNQPVNFNMGASDADGDSLVYSFIPARDAATVNLPYATGYSATQPIPGAMIDPSTGQITFTPTVIGNFVFAVLIQEYDSLGNMVGSVVQDFQFQVINCTNIVPESPSAGITNFTGTGTLTGPASIEICDTGSVCFDLIFTDDDVSQILTVTSNIASVLPSATFSQSGTNPVTVSICYTAQATDPSFSTISFTAEDNACPIAAFSSMNISISILSQCCTMPDVLFTDEQCSQSNGTITVIGQGNGPWDFEWINTADTSNILLSQTDVDTSMMTNLPAGNYRVIVTDSLGCNRYAYVTISDVGSTGFTTTITDETCSGYQNGAIAVTPGAGISPFTVEFSDAGGVIQTNPNVTSTTTLSNLPSGTYTISIEDSAGCTYDSTIIIASGAIITTNGNITPETCFEYNNASIASNASGGTGPYTYYLSGTSADTTTNGNFTNLAAGNYTVLAVDANGCSDTASFTVVNTPEVIAAFLANPVSGIPPLTVNFTNTSQNATNYVWIFNDGTPNSNLSDPVHVFVNDSTFNVILIASNGPCVDTATIFITTILSSLDMPNVFSPNGDGVNDYFTGIEPMNISEYECVIYNRWGLKIRTVESVSPGWDGKDEQGKLCSDGVYIYIVTAKGLDGVNYNFQGHVTLLSGK